MTLFSYEIFDAVARQGSFNKAAQQLHLTPSAISHAIAVMEEELGFALFNRGKNGVSMTSYGASLYPSIRDALNSAAACRRKKETITNRTTDLFTAWLSFPPPSTAAHARSASP